MEELVSIACNRFCVAGIVFSFFERALTQRGMENLLCNMRLDPGFVHALLARIPECSLKILDIALEYDVDGVYFGDD